MKPCKPQRLATSPAAEVWMCADCGTFHVHIGPVTLRLQTDTFPIVAATLQAGLDAIGHLGPAEEAPRTGARH